jgi:hypothetical protein
MEIEVAKRNVTGTTAITAAVFSSKSDPLTRWIARSPRPNRLIRRMPTKRPQ